MGYKYKEWALGQGSEAASASTEGGKECRATEAGEKVVKKIKATESSSEEKCSVLKEHIWELQKKSWMVRKGSTRKTYKESDGGD